MSEQPTDDEVSPEIRAAHQKAFDDAVVVLETELKQLGDPKYTLAVLTAVRNDFEAWDDGQIDGPMPPLATVERLRADFRYVQVDKMQWNQAADYAGQVHKVFYRHMGGGTSMSYKLFAIFQKGLTAANASLRSGAHEKALCHAIKLTKAMSDNDEWYGDTDLPEQAAQIVKALGNLWSKILSGPAEQRNWAMLLAWLESIRKEWEGAASEHLGLKMKFSFPERPPSTPQKNGSVAQGKQESTPPAVEKASGSKKRKSTEGISESKTKKVRGDPAPADIESWLHQFDSDLPKRQASAVQLCCRGVASKQIRVIIVSGAYPLKAVGFALAEAFGKAAGDFDPHPNKGKVPPGLAFFLVRDGKQSTLKPTLKIVQAVQEPGDGIIVKMEGLDLTVSLDAIKFKGDLGFDHIKDRPMPRCVGGDLNFDPQQVKRLNRIFFCDRKPINFLGCSKREAVNGTIEEMSKPIALKRGEVVIECLGLGFGDPPGGTPTSNLRPITLQSDD